jgi:hypothetical protein
MTAPPSGAQKAWTNAFFKGLKAKGIYAVLGELYIPAQDQQAAALNLISTSGTLLPVNAPTFTAFRGWSGDGASAYLNTQVNINAIPNWTQDNASFGAFFTASTNSPGNGRAWGRSGSATGFQLDCSTSRINTSTVTSFVSPPATPAMFSSSRVGASEERLYINGVLNTVGESASTTPVVAPAHLLRVGAGYGTSAFRLGVAWVGGSLTDTQHADMYTLCFNLLTAMGAPTS